MASAAEFKQRVFGLYSNKEWLLDQMCQDKAIVLLVEDGKHIVFHDHPLPCCQQQ